MIERLKRPWYILCQTVLQVLFVILFRLRIHGQEKVPGSGGVVIASNHQSFLDPMLIGVGLSRSSNYMARASLFRLAPFRWLIQSLNAFPFHREGIDTEAVREAIRRVGAGEVLVIFPEGTRTTDGRISRIKKGAGLISRRGRAAIVPAVIDGAFEVWPRDRALPRPSRIDVAFGEPISYDALETMTEGEIAEAISDQMAALQTFLFGKRGVRR